MGLQFGALSGQQAGPIVAFGDGRRLVVPQQRIRRAAPLIHHLEEDEVGELLQVVAVGQPGVPQDVAVVPQLLADVGRMWSYSLLPTGVLPRMGVLGSGGVLACCWTWQQP